MVKVIAVDFDGCICTNVWPNIGEPNWAVIKAIQEEQKLGAKVILWTCRDGKDLDEALAACNSWGILFDAINDNLPERIELYGTNPRKVTADEYWDDRAVRKGE